MIAIASFLSVTAGTACASMAARFPGYVEALETGAGALLIGGFALAGCALPVIL
jgi:hypothetical protein